MSDVALTTHPAPAAMARAAYPSNDRLSADQIGEAAAARLHYAAGVRAERVRFLAILTSLDQGDWLLGRLRRLATDVEASLQTSSTADGHGDGRAVMSHDPDRARAAAQAWVLGGGLEILAVAVNERPSDAPLVGALAEELLALLERLEDSLATIDALTAYKGNVTDLRRRLQAEGSDPTHDPHADEAYLTWARRWRRAAEGWRTDQTSS